MILPHRVCSNTLLKLQDVQRILGLWHHLYATSYEYLLYILAFIYVKAREQADALE
jgi:hypothetical protein